MTLLLILDVEIPLQHVERGVSRDRLDDPQRDAFVRCSGQRAPPERVLTATLDAQFSSFFMEDFALESAGLISTSSTSRRIMSFGVDSCAATTAMPLNVCTDYP